MRTGQLAPFEEYHEQDAWLESCSEGQIASSLAIWQAAGIRPQPEQPRRLLDVACGCAIKSLALAQQDPALHVTCLDTARVLPVARALAERMGLLGQTAFVTADLLSAGLGADLYELCLLGQITHYLTGAQNRDLFRRIQAALRPGGTLVIDVPMTGEQPAEWTQIVSLLLWANGGGATHPFDEYNAWLHEAKFGLVNRPGERWIAAVNCGEVG